MITKRLWILANSVKKGGRCVAGRELRQEGGETVLGSWIRPVRPDDEGTLWPGDYRTDANQDVAVLDVVDIDLTGHEPGPGQPENWLLAPSHPRWRFVRRVELGKAVLQRLEEDVSDLWWAADKSDRISVEQQAKRAPQRSLVMVAPQHLRVRWGWEYNEWQEHWRERYMAEFDHGGHHYSLKITDPVFRARVDAFRRPVQGQAWLETQPPGGVNCLLCVSLTPHFRDDHYKVVATVLTAE